MPDPRVTIIVDVVARACNVTAGAVMGRDLTKPACEARMISMAMVRELLGISLPKTGRAFRRDHSTVAHAAKMLSCHLDKVPGFETRLALIRAEARQALDAADIIITACDTLRDDLIRKVKADPAVALARIVNAFNLEDRA